jgi:hypothetical protein
MVEKKCLKRRKDDAADSEWNANDGAVYEGPSASLGYACEATGRRRDFGGETGDYGEDVRADYVWGGEGDAHVRALLRAAGAQAQRVESVCMCVCMYVFVSVRVHVCVYACVYVCMCICMRVKAGDVMLCMYACMYVCIIRMYIYS